MKLRCEWRGACTASSVSEVSHPWPVPDEKVKGVNVIGLGTWRKLHNGGGHG